MVHGGIDGFSRFIVYLTCNTNNSSRTVLELFYKAVCNFGLPDKVRSDKGGENVKVGVRIVKRDLASYPGPCSLQKRAWVQG